jgi:hypothetical protein
MSGAVDQSPQRAALRIGNDQLLVDEPRMNDSRQSLAGMRGVRRLLIACFLLALAVGIIPACWDRPSAFPDHLPFATMRQAVLLTVVQVSIRDV